MALTLEQRATINTVKEQINLITKYLEVTRTSILTTYEDSKVKVTKSITGVPSYELSVKQGTTTITYTKVYAVSGDTTNAFRTGKWLKYIEDLAQDALDAETALTQSAGVPFTAFNDAAIFPTYTSGSPEENMEPLKEEEDIQLEEVKEEQSKETENTLKPKTSVPAESIDIKKPEKKPNLTEVTNGEVVEVPTLVGEEEKNFSK